MFRAVTLHRMLKLAAAPIALGVLSACGGGGGGVDVADGGIRGTGSSVGPVSGFGSVFVNGVMRILLTEIVHRAKCRLFSQPKIAITQLCAWHHFVVAHKVP